MIGLGMRLRGEASLLGSGAEKSEGERVACCNTPPSSEKHSTCIDYLKFTFPHGYGSEEEKFASIIKILDVRIDGWEQLNPMHGFTSVYRLAPGTNLAYGGTMTIRTTGEETTMLELSGEGCREFEDRYFSGKAMENQAISRSETIRQAWIDLIEACLELEGECKRVDIPTDDYSGNITLDELKKKISTHSYSTKLRSLQSTDEGFEAFRENIKDIKTIRDSKLTGYSATFGTRKTVQLCIYDKLAERHSKGIDPGLDSWVRYEVRFYHERAEVEICSLLFALQAGESSSYIIGCLASIMDFKEESNFSDSNKCKAPTWSKWLVLTQSGSEPETFGAVPKLMTVETNASWLVREGAKSFLRILTALQGRRCSVIGSAMALKALSKIDNTDLQYINQYLKGKGRRQYKDLDEIKKYVFSIPDLDMEFDGETTELLMEKCSKAEIAKNRSEQQAVKEGASA